MDGVGVPRQRTHSRARRRGRHHPSLQHLEASNHVVAREVGVFAHIVVKMGFKKAFRFASLQLKMDRMRRKIAPTAYHLEMLGVDSDFQGRGAGTEILRESLRRLDAEGREAYLESSNPRNVPFYRRQGFEVVDENFPLEADGGVTGRGPVITLMRRFPRQQQQQEQ